MTPSIASSSAAERALPRPRILVVDDTEDNLFLMAAMLEDQYDVSLAFSGADALAVAGSGEPPDLILLDIMMPGMDGYEVMRQLRAGPVTQDIPVIFLTALTSNEEEQYGLDLGVVDYIHKPFKPPLLLARVKAQLERSARAHRLHLLSCHVAALPFPRDCGTSDTMATEVYNADLMPDTDLSNDLADLRSSLRPHPLEQQLAETRHALKERTRELSEARRAQLLLLATIDATSDGILATQFSDGAMYYNIRFVEMWGIPEESLEMLDEATLTGLQMAQAKDPQALLALIERPRANRETEETVLVELADGRVLQRQVQPQRLRGQVVGSVVSYRDVTGRARYESHPKAQSHDRAALRKPAGGPEPAAYRAAHAPRGNVALMALAA